MSSKNKSNNKSLELVINQFIVSPSINSIEKTSAGQVNNSYIVNTTENKYVLRETKKNVSDIIYESSILNHLFDNNFSVPLMHSSLSKENMIYPDSMSFSILMDEPLFTEAKSQINTFVRQNDSFYQLFEFCQGYSLKEGKANESQLNNLGENIGVMNNLLFNFEPQGGLSEGEPFMRFKNAIDRFNYKDYVFFDILPKFLDSTSNKINITNKEKDYLLDYLPYLEDHLTEIFEDLPKSVIHSDITNDNVLFSENEVNAILDFDDAHVDCRILDPIASSLYFATTNYHLDLEKYNKIFEGYTSKLENEVTNLETKSVEPLTKLYSSSAVFWLMNKFNKDKSDKTLDRFLNYYKLFNDINSKNYLEWQKII